MLVSFATRQHYFNLAYPGPLYFLFLGEGTLETKRDEVGFLSDFKAFDRITVRLRVGSEGRPHFYNFFKVINITCMETMTRRQTKMEIQRPAVRINPPGKVITH